MIAGCAGDHVGDGEALLGPRQEQPWSLHRWTGSTRRRFSANEQLRLHEALARYISGLPTPLTGPSGTPYGPVWPLDTLPLARWRAHLIVRLQQHPYSYLYAPDPQIAADLITGEYV
ncbi:hypothetical protein ABT086_10520 [Streptomyces mirabilis]